MMGWGPMGSGAGVNYSSSSSSIPNSNLSASAPPFTVDRLYPNSSSNPNLHYPKSPYSIEPYSRTWQYAAHPSAPAPDLVISSTGISSVPLYDDCQFSVSASVSPSFTKWCDPSPSVKASGSAYGYGGEVDPYYSPCVLSMVGENSSVTEDNGPRYSVLATSGMTSQINYTPSLFDLEFGRQWVDSVRFDDVRQSKGVEVDGSLFSEKANVVDSICFENQLNQGACGGEYWNKSKEDSGAPYQKFNQVSDLELQNIGFLYESNKAHIGASNSVYPESNPLLQSYEMQDKISNYRNAFSPYEKCVRPVDSPFTDPTSVIRSYAAAVIGPPPATNGNLGHGIASCTPAVKEPLTPLHAEDAYAWKIKARFGSQLPNMNALDDSSMTCDGVQFANSSEGCSDFFDHNNNGVDSPCWKGAPSSQFKSFDVEAGNSTHVNKHVNEYYDHHQNLLSTIDSTRLISEKGGEVSMYGKKECTKNGVVFTLERPLSDICSSREIVDGPNSLSKEYGLLNNLKSGFDMQNLGLQHFVGEDETGMALNDVPEGGEVAVHMAEEVLDSPCSEQDAIEPTKLLNPKLNVPTMIKAIHNLSELLLYHLSNDACSLDEENNETLKHIISNLDSCMTKKIAQVNNMLEPNNLVRDTSDKLGKSCNVGTTSGIPCTTHKAEKSIPTDYLGVHEGKINYNFSGEKDEKSAVFSSLRDDFDKTRDVMAEAIKKVLEDNFQFDAEMHSQALHFKSLWLETEVKLCSINCKARFDLLKNMMEKFKLRAPRENDDIAKMMSKVCISSDPTTACQVSPKACDVTIPISTIQNLSISSTSGPGSEVEASVMTGFNISTSQAEKLEPISSEKEKQCETVDDEHVDPIEMPKLIKTEEEKQPGMDDIENVSLVMARFHILKSREEKSTSVNSEEEEQPEMIDGEHAGSLMERFNILKSRDEKSKSVHMEDEERLEMNDDEFYMGSCNTRDESSEDKILNVTLKPHFMLQSEGIFGSYADGSGNTNDPMVGSHNSSSRIINQDYSEWHDSSSSDWEHV